jgi:hypothetical protein
MSVQDKRAYTPHIHSPRLASDHVIFLKWLDFILYRSYKSTSAVALMVWCDPHMFTQKEEQDLRCRKKKKDITSSFMMFADGYLVILK